MEKTTNKKESNFLFEMLSNNVKVKEGIYCNIPKNATEKEKKSIRVKNRRILENAIEKFNNGNKEFKVQFSKCWEEYAKTIFKDCYVLFDANKSDEKSVVISKFVTDIKTYQKM